MLAIVLRVPFDRALRKYQSRSLKSGPPSCAVTSHSLLSLFADVSPGWGVKLSPWNVPLEPARYSEPRCVLPPSRGTTLIDKPELSDSPNPPAVVMLVSCAAPTLI